MKVIKKTAMMLVVATAFAMNVSAQEKGDMAAGLGVVLGTGNDLTNFGIGAKFQYNVTNPLRLEGSFSYFFPKKEGEGDFEVSTSMWDLSVNAHYLFSMSERLTFYPLAGLGILGVTSSSEINVPGIEVPGLGEYGGYSDSVSASASQFGINLGGGEDFKLSEKLVLNGQLKYMIAGNWSRLIISAGLAYRF
jgi:outer membrane protein X